MRRVLGYCFLVASLLVTSTAGAVDDAQQCQSGKLKVAGKYDFCRLMAEARAAKTGGVPDYAKCDLKFADKWSRTELGGGGMCPSNGDQSAIQAFITQHTDDLAAALAGGPLPDCSAGGVLKTGQTTAHGTGSDGDLQKGAARSFSDNGDGTITDNTTGLMWEKKSEDGTIHDKGNLYSWCKDTSPADGTCDTAGFPMDGTMVTTFLAGLNGGGGFAGHTDWRIPNRFELESLLNLQNVAPSVSSAFNTSCAATCTVTTCSCTSSSFHWSSTTYGIGLDSAWLVAFGDAYVDKLTKSNGLYVRAVRGGS